MSFFTGTGAAFVLLCVVVMVAIGTILALLAFATREWPTEKEKGIDEVQQYKLHQRLAEITNKTMPDGRSA